MLRAASRPQGNRAGQGCQCMALRLRVSYWGDWAEMRTSWGLGFRVKVREGGGVLNRVFFPHQMEEGLAEMEVSLNLAPC